jgi:hypothetical protein
VAINAPNVPAAALLRRVPADFVKARELDPLASLGHDAWIDAVCGGASSSPTSTSTGPTRSLEMELEFVDGRAAVDRVGAQGAAEVLLKRADRMFSDLDVASKRTRYGRGFLARAAAAPAEQQAAGSSSAAGAPAALQGGSDKPLDLSSVADDDGGDE